MIRLFLKLSFIGVVFVFIHFREAISAEDPFYSDKDPFYSDDDMIVFKTTKTEKTDDKTLNTYIVDNISSDPTPWVLIECSFRYKQSLKISSGTGILIHPNIILTSSHILNYPRGEEGSSYPESIACYGKISKDIILFQRKLFIDKENPKNLLISKKYRQDGFVEREHGDIAIIILDKDEEINEIPFCTPFSFSDKIEGVISSKFNFNIFGYGYDHSLAHKRALCSDSGKIVIKNGEIEHKMYSSPGYSGAGIWTKHDDYGMICIGVHNGKKNDAEKFGSLLTEEIIDKIEKIIGSPILRISSNLLFE